jgi:hypothetical protein
MSNPTSPESPADREAIIQELEESFHRPVLPGWEERRRRTREALRHAEEHLRRSPIGRGDW